MKQPNWTRILTVLLVILAAYAVLYVSATLLFHFTHAIVLFTLGALVAYVLTPMVNGLEGLVKVRWIAITISYLALVVVIFTVGVLLFTPFIQQSQSLVDNLHTPSADSLQTFTRVESQALVVQRELNAQLKTSRAGGALPAAVVERTLVDIIKLRTVVDDLQVGTLSGIGRPPPPPKKPVTSDRAPANPPSQTRMPPSYVAPLAAQVTLLAGEYGNPSLADYVVDPGALQRAVNHAKRERALARKTYAEASSLPILLLRSQTWLDNHGVNVSLYSKFGEAGKQLSDQGTYLLDNAVAIVSATANLLLNTTLVLIIAFYFLLDGKRMVHAAPRLFPERYREHTWFFLQSLDRVVGGYVRGQLFLSAVAAILAGAGAAILGVPYPLLIGMMTFVLQAVPVIGPIITVVPPVAIALFFTSVLTGVTYLVWILISQQLVSNILGPRIMGMAVGIHPLEAMVAVLVGYPLGGLLGAFLAVPVAGVIHIVVREMHAYFFLGQALPTSPVPSSESAGTVRPLTPLNSDPGPEGGSASARGA